MILRALSASILLSGAVLAQLPAVPVPAQNPLTPAKVVLGKILFWDEQLSSDDTVACGTCHMPEAGGTDPRSLYGVHPGLDGLVGTADDIHGSPGVVRQRSNGDYAPQAPFGLQKQVGGRLANTTLGAAHHDNLFWDGRASTQFIDPETQQVLIPFGGALESQAVGPIMNPVEMATEGRTWAEVRQKLQNVRPLALATDLTPDIQAALQQDPYYPALFATAFGDPAITAARIAYAIASYERTLTPDDTPWDRYVQGQSSALNQAEKDGWALFQTSARCRNCHTEPLFTDDLSHPIGLRPLVEDRGLGAISQLPQDDGSFKTPTLRNAGLRPRQFHNGQSPALGDPTQLTDPASVLNVYLNGGGVDRQHIDPYVIVLNQHGVTAADLQKVIDFVRTALTDPRCAQALPPFDHPTLHSHRVAEPQPFGQGLAGSIEPFFVATAPAWLGNAGWKLGLAAGDGPTTGLLGYGLRSMPPGVSFGGLPWNVEVLDARFVPLSGPPGQPGHATWRLPIPADPGLAGLQVAFQLWALDPLAPHGIGTSRGLGIAVQ
jgi:cytochrome c peroxidase